jgi:sRNA-binding protein
MDNSSDAPAEYAAEWLSKEKKRRKERKKERKLKKKKKKHTHRDRDSSSASEDDRKDSPTAVYPVLAMPPTGASTSLSSRIIAEPGSDVSIEHLTASISFGYTLIRLPQ